MSGICEGRVVIITGAGGGLGREYALAFAREGASVVVNDINREAAERTVAEIAALGARAIADTGDITAYADAGGIVRAALDAFGDLHVVVNNAGICRDRMFVSLSEQDWDDVIRVHLKGHFCISSHACQYWRAQVKEGRPVSGRIINTSSGAGLQGSIGQANYSAAKGGIASLTLVQAAELRRYHITANALAPSARTGMTEGVFAEMMKKPEDGSFDHFDPANVAPLVVWLGSEHSARVTGRVFEVEGGRIAIGDGWRSTAGVDAKRRWEPREVGSAMERLLAEEVPAQKVFGT
jgi:NAD(P)-dependent dehydrogenase (short-subunit alcohol dehydrogenase family)